MFRIGDSFVRSSRGETFGAADKLSAAPEAAAAPMSRIRDGRAWSPRQRQPNRLAHKPLNSAPMHL
jgi:hypothetical protein